MLPFVPLSRSAAKHHGTGVGRVKNHNHNHNNQHHTVTRSLDGSAFTRSWRSNCHSSSEAVSQGLVILYGFTISVVCMLVIPLRSVSTGFIKDQPPPGSHSRAHLPPFPAHTLPL